MAMKVVGRMDGTLIVKRERPEYCSGKALMPGDIVEDDEGRWWRMVHNHNGQRLRGHLITMEERNMSALADLDATQHDASWRAQ